MVLTLKTLGYGRYTEPFGRLSSIWNWWNHLWTQVFTLQGEATLSDVISAVLCVLNGRNLGDSVPSVLKQLLVGWLLIDSMVAVPLNFITGPKSFCFVEIFLNFKKPFNYLWVIKFNAQVSSWIFSGWSERGGFSLPFLRHNKLVDVLKKGFWSLYNLWLVHFHSVNNALVFWANISFLSSKLACWQCTRPLQRKYTPLTW